MSTLALAPVRPLATEKQPKPELPKNYRPKDAYEYKVVDGDSWVTLGARLSVDPKALVHFNFQTNDPGEVNWYLRTRTGCRLPTPDKMNWMFSRDASPGLIWLPNKKLDYRPITITSQKTISAMALEFEGPNSPLDALGKFFDVFNLVSTASSIFSTSLVLEGLMIGGGIVAGPAAMFVMVGGPHEAALNELRKKQILQGLSLGIVLTADSRTPQYIQSHGYVQMWPVRDINYPEYGKQLQGIYNGALIAGIKHGMQFNSVAVHNLFAWIGSQMNESARKEYKGNESHNWSARKWRNYYDLCAAILQRKMVLR